MRETSDGGHQTYRKRCRRFNDPGHAHALTFTCFQGQAFLSRDRTRSWMHEAIQQARAVHQFHVWAYVLMPEHMHLLIWPQLAEYDIGTILSSLKRPVARKAVSYLKMHAPESLSRMKDLQPNGKSSYRFWQHGGGYDRNLWEPRYIWETIDYFHLNPVRRGLCERPEEWLWSSARDYAGIARGSVEIDRTSLPDDPRR